MILIRRVASAGVNRSWMVRGAIEFPSLTVLMFRRNWTWIAACVRKYNDMEKNQQHGSILILHVNWSCSKINLLACACNYSHSPSLSRMLTVAESRPGTNEAGAVASPEITKLSVPSTRKSSIISTTRLWTLSLLVPRHNVNFWKTRRKSSFTASTLKNVTLNDTESFIDRNISWRL